MLTGISVREVEVQSDTYKYMPLVVTCYSAALHLPKLLQHVHIQKPMYKTEDLNHANSNTNYIKENLSLCTSVSLMEGGIASHILTLELHGEEWSS